MRMVFSSVMSFMKSSLLKKCMFILETKTLVAMQAGLMEQKITNGIKLTLQPIPGEVDGTIYYDNRYDVSIGYNKFGIKYPQ